MSLLQPATERDVVDGVGAAQVAYPTSTHDVAEVMKNAAAQGLSVLARGAGSKLTWGVPPRSADLVVDLSRMDQVREHAAGDLIVTAQAGTPLAQLQDSVAAAGQRLGVEEMVPGTTVGGLIATNPSGPRRVALGTVRDLLIGVTIVRADGVIAKAGGKVVKNVAGYDLGKLMVGSYGTLGVVAEATFRLHPIPPASCWLTVQAPHPRDTADLAAALVASQTVPAAVEIDAVPAGPTQIGVLIEGTERGVAGRADRMTTLLGPTAQRADTWATGYPGDGDLGRTLLKLTAQLSSTVELASTAVDLGWHVRGSLGAGVLYASSDRDEPDDAIIRLRGLATAAGGALVVLDAPLAVKRRTDVWGPVPAIDLMRRVKSEFDPESRLAPGRFVGGI